MNNRLKHFTAMLLIGDGIMAMLRPQHDAIAWSEGPWIWRTAMKRLARCPAMARTIGAVQVAGGIWWMLRQESPDTKTLAS
jgi:hypothetical protein